MGPASLQIFCIFFIRRQTITYYYAAIVIAKNLIKNVSVSLFPYYKENIIAGAKYPEPIRFPLYFDFFFINMQMCGSSYLLLYIFIFRSCFIGNSFCNVIN